MHGGASTGPKTLEGLKNSRQAPWKHGLCSATRKRLRRQLTWVGEFTKVLSRLDKMYRLLLDTGETIDLGRSGDVLESKCATVLPLYAGYLEVLVVAPTVGIETGKSRLEPDERRLLAALCAGADGATAQDLHKMLAGELPGAKCMIAELLARHEPRIERLFGLALGKIREGFRACEVSRDDGAECIDRPDHRIRLLAVNRFCRLLALLVLK
jgi:hypothetical protein